MKLTSAQSDILRTLSRPGAYIRETSRSRWELYNPESGAWWNTTRTLNRRTVERLAALGLIVRDQRVYYTKQQVGYFLAGGVA